MDQVSPIHTDCVPSVAEAEYAAWLDLGELVKRAIKYLVEGLVMVAIAAYAIHPLFLTCRAVTYVRS
jgi:hypothetical protein